MGNYGSCLYIPINKTAKLMDSQGNFRHLNVPVKAAELMLEEPGYVVSPVHEIRRTRRIIALRAEDELLAGKLYMLVPLSKLHRKISESVMEVIESAVSSNKRSNKKRRGAKVLPAVPLLATEAAEDASESEVEVEVEVEVQKGHDAGFSGCRLGNYRQWTPALEPISEEV